MKNVLSEYQVIAYCAAYLIGKESTLIKELAVKKKHVEEVKKLMKKALEEKYNFGDEQSREELIEQIEYNEKKESDIRGDYISGDKKQRDINIEAKGGDVIYGIYTLMGQLATLRINPSDYYWYGAACPEEWKKAIKNKLMHEGEIKPIIQSMIDNFTSYKRGLKFYFVSNDGEVEAVHWHNFLK